MAGLPIQEISYTQQNVKNIKAVHWPKQKSIEQKILRTQVRHKEADI